MFIALHLQGADIPAFKPKARHLARLRAAFPDAVIHNCASESEFLKILPRATHALVWSFRNDWLALAPNLRHIATPAAGRDWIEPASNPQIPKSQNLQISFGSFHGQLIAQTLLAQLLAFNRGVLHAGQRGRWPSSDENFLWQRARLATHCRDVRGTRAVILGFGHIGQAIGRHLKFFNIRVTGLRRDASQPPPDWFTRGDRLLPATQLEEVLPRADHLICALPASPETNLLLDARRLSLLPRRAAVYNVGRGNVLDEAALARLLCARKIRGALLDVFQTEPLPKDSPLFTAPNFFPLPHASAFAPNYLDLWLDEILGFGNFGI